MKITRRRATLAQAEEDADSEDESDWEEEEGGGGGGAEVSAFDVASVPFIDDELATEQETRWPLATDPARPHSASCRYVVVSGTPLKILEHLLSDLRLDDQRGAPESRESGESLDPVSTGGRFSLLCGVGHLRGGQHPFVTSQRAPEGSLPSGWSQWEVKGQGRGSRLSALERHESRHDWAPARGWLLPLCALRV